MNKNINIISVFKIVILAALPMITVILYLLNPLREGRTLFTFLVLFFIFERAWEAFYTGGYKKEKVSEIDWTLFVTTILYILLIIFCLCEFYLIKRKLNLLITIPSIIIYLFAIFFRLWSVQTLGDQWSIHIIKPNNQDKRKLITKGPYKLVRHPIYLGTMLEQVSGPLILGLYYTSFAMLVLTVPFHIVKARIEEGILIFKVGNCYKDYSNKTGSFNIFRSLMSNYKIK
jgi:protein-S-isoprenylcysteine O-methyltransferase Ste14